MNHDMLPIPDSVLSHQADLIDHDKYLKSAVCIPLIELNGEFHVLFEVRSSKVNKQPGDVCFPGGMLEEDETPLDAAIREMTEELLVKRSQIIPVAASDYIMTNSRLYIYPFVVRLMNYKGTFSEDEVSEVFTIPLKDILNQKPELHLVKSIPIPPDDFPFDRIAGGRNYKWRTRTEKEIFYQFGDRTIWGLTARLLHAFAKIWGVEYNK